MDVMNVDRYYGDAPPGFIKAAPTTGEYWRWRVEYINLTFGEMRQMAGSCPAGWLPLLEWSLLSVRCTYELKPFMTDALGEEFGQLIWRVRTTSVRRFDIVCNTIRLSTTICSACAAQQLLDDVRRLQLETETWHTLCIACRALSAVDVRYRQFPETRPGWHG